MSGSRGPIAKTAILSAPRIRTKAACATKIKIINTVDIPNGSGLLASGNRLRPAAFPDPRGGQPAPAGDGKLDDVSTEVMPDSDLKVHEDLKVDTSHGDHERFAHYVDKNDMMNAAVFGTPIKALCGKVWVPSRDPQKFPVCPECKEIYESLPPGDGDENE
jgi:Protein of unknown function (DUF3039)